MELQGTVQRNDVTILPFLQASTESESERLLERLILDYAEPIIKNIVGYNLRSENRGKDSVNQVGEDVCSESIVQLLTHLQSLKVNPEEKTIGSFRNYVAVITYRTY